MRTIQVDADSVKGQLPACYRKCVGSGRACLGLRADYQAHLRLARKECGFEYIRFHGLLHDDIPEVVEEIVIPSPGSTNLNFDLKENEVYLVTFARIE